MAAWPVSDNDREYEKAIYKPRASETGLLLVRREYREQAEAANTEV